jgi:hypothetical protein
LLERRDVLHGEFDFLCYKLCNWLLVWRLAFPILTDILILGSRH